MHISFSLAFRFLRSSHHEKNISVMVKICFISIALGAGALTLVAAIMNGFERATYEKFQNIHPDLTLAAGGKALDSDKILQVLHNEFSHIIAAASPAASSQLLIQNAHDSAQIGLVALQAVDPLTRSQIRDITQILISSDKVTSTSSLQTLLDGPALLIGQPLAEYLNIKTGDSVNLLIPDQEIISNKVTFSPSKAHIAGLFKTGIAEFDEHILLGSLDWFNTLFQTGISQVQLKLKSPYREAEAIALLKKRFNLDVTSWKDTYPAIVSALLLEKYAMWIILLLVILIASMNIVTLLYMFITQKRRDIAILKAMGTPQTTIIMIFIWLGMGIAIPAAALGILGAAGISWLLDTYALIKLPDIYYVSYLPAYLDLYTLCLLFCILSIVSFCASFIPAYQTKDIHIARILKYELS